MNGQLNNLTEKGSSFWIMPFTTNRVLGMNLPVLKQLNQFVLLRDRVTLKI